MAQKSIPESKGLLDLRPVASLGLRVQGLGFRVAKPHRLSRGSSIVREVLLNEPCTFVGRQIEPLRNLHDESGWGLRRSTRGVLQQQSPESPTMKLSILATGYGNLMFRCF